MIDLLRDNIQQAVTITDEQFVEIKHYFLSKHFSKGEFIFREDEKVPFIFFIVSGLVKLSYWDMDGKEHIASFAMEDWWETDFTAFYSNNTSKFSLQCMENTTAYSLSLDDYKKLCLLFPQLVAYFLDKSIKGHIANQKRIISLLSQNPKEKYEQFIQSYPALVQRIPKSTIAAYLGLSRETLSRLYQDRKTKL